MKSSFGLITESISDKALRETFSSRCLLLQKRERERDGRSELAGRCGSPRRDNPNQLDSHAGSERARTQPGAAFYFALKPVFMPRVSMANMIRTHSRYFFALAQQATESLQIKIYTPQTFQH
jgi:hypothetical protein